VIKRRKEFSVTVAGFVDDEEFGPECFPPRSEYSGEGDVVQPKVFQHLNPDLKRLYCGDHCLPQRRVSPPLYHGLRALIEGICRDKGLTDGNLEQEIEGHTKFLPNPTLIKAWHNFRIMGNSAAHRLEALTREDARAAIEIMEDTMNFLYHLDYQASQIRDAPRNSSFRSASKEASFSSVKPGHVNYEIHSCAVMAVKDVRQPWIKRTGAGRIPTVGIARTTVYQYTGGF
jgi:Domain of unknown function (DUF4145)